MSTNSRNHPVEAFCNGILRKRSLNVPQSIARTTTTTTPSTLTNSSHSNRAHVQFDHDDRGRTDRTSLLALAHMPASNDDDDGLRGPNHQSHFEEQQAHDLDQLIDYDGDSDDENDDANALVCDIDNTTNDREGENAVEARDEGFTPCDDMMTVEELQKQQEQANAPLLIDGAPPGWKKPTAP